MSDVTTYWIAQHADGTYTAGETPPGYVTTFGNGVKTSWSDTDREKWIWAAKNLGIEIAEED